MQPRRDELVRWGETAVQQLRGPVFDDLRRRFAGWRDPRARLLRRRRRSKRVAGVGATGAGVFGIGSYASAAADPVWDGLGGFADLAQMTSAFGLGGLAVVSGAGAIGAGLRYRKLKREPLPDPAPVPVALPPRDSDAREPMQRLQEAEQTLHKALAQLSGTAAGSAPADARGTADVTAAELRTGSERLQAVESAIEHSPSEDRAALRADVRRMRSELDDGVEEYGTLVAAAGRAVAASGAPEQRDALRDATDRLAGLAAGLKEVFGSPDGGSGSGRAH